MFTAGRWGGSISEPSSESYSPSSSDSGRGMSSRVWYRRLLGQARAYGREVAFVATEVLGALGIGGLLKMLKVSNHEKERKETVIRRQ